MASTRLEETPDVEIDTAKGQLSWDLARRVLSRWRWYGCSLLFGISGETESFGSNNLMGQWLKAVGGYTVEQIGESPLLYIVQGQLRIGSRANHGLFPMVDYYPSGLTAFGIASTLVCATWTDYTRARWPVLVYFSIACIISSIILLNWSTPTAAKFFAYCGFRNTRWKVNLGAYVLILSLDLSGASYAGQATTFA